MEHYQVASMKDSSISWFPELGEVDDYYDLVDGFIAENSVTTQEDVQKRSSQSPESYTSDYSIFVPKNNGNNVSGTTICFGGGSASSESLDFQADGGFERPVKRVKVDDKKSSSFHVLSGSTKGDDVRRCSVAHEHVLAERKRRENLTQKFIALSAILPGLKKMDKASVLEEAIKQLKELKERVKQLEEQGKKTRSEEPAVVVVKTSLPNIPPDAEDHYSCSSDDGRSSEEASPEIEVRFSGDNVLIRLHCSKKRGKTMSFFLREVEILHLTVLNSFMTPFGEHAMDFTLVAQMDENFCMKPKDMVKHLECIARRFMNS